MGSIPDGVCGPGVDSASNRNEYKEYFLGDKGSQCIGLTTLPPSCADCLEIWEPQPPGTVRACPGLAFLYCAASALIHYNVTLHKICYAVTFS
jgi:hypothetical protein